MSGRPAAHTRGAAWHGMAWQRSKSSGYWHATSIKQTAAHPGRLQLLCLPVALSHGLARVSRVLQEEETVRCLLNSHGDWVCPPVASALLSACTHACLQCHPRPRARRRRPHPRAAGSRPPLSSCRLAVEEHHRAWPAQCSAALRGAFPSHPPTHPPTSRSICHCAPFISATPPPGTSVLPWYFSAGGKEAKGRHGEE